MKTLALWLMLALTAAIASPAVADSGAAHKVVLSEKLAHVPGQRLTSILVSYAPGGKSARHHHAGAVFAFVVSGAIRSQNSATGPVRVYRAGEGFFEPPGSIHLISENASATEPATLLAVFVADEGAKLTVAEP